MDAVAFKKKALRARTGAHYPGLSLTVNTHNPCLINPRKTSYLPYPTESLL